MSYPQVLTADEKLTQAKEGLALPHIVVICGSTRFMEDMREANLRETAAGRIVLAPGVNMKKPHALWATDEQVDALKPMLDDLHKAKIRLADEVLIVGDYIGESTRSEIRYAASLGMPIRYTHPEVNPLLDGAE